MNGEMVPFTFAGLPSGVEYEKITGLQILHETD